MNEPANTAHAQLHEQYQMMARQIFVHQAKVARDNSLSYDKEGRLRSSRKKPLSATISILPRNEKIWMK